MSAETEIKNSCHAEQEGKRIMNMDRRDFLKTTALGSSLGAVTTAGLLADVAGAAHHEASGGMAGESQKAFAELREAIAEIDAGFSEPAWRITTPNDLADRTTRVTIPNLLARPPLSAH